MKYALITLMALLITCTETSISPDEIYLTDFSPTMALSEMGQKRYCGFRFSPQTIDPLDEPSAEERADTFLLVTKQVIEAETSLVISAGREPRKLNPIGIHFNSDCPSESEVRRVYDSISTLYRKEGYLIKQFDE